MTAPEQTQKRQRSEVVNMRIEPNQLDLIDAAANPLEFSCLER
jgi:uncharacterized protein (DUF1778 family)